MSSMSSIGEMRKLVSDKQAFDAAIEQHKKANGLDSLSIGDYNERGLVGVDSVEAYDAAISQVSQLGGLSKIDAFTMSLTSTAERVLHNDLISGRLAETRGKNDILINKVARHMQEATAFASLFKEGGNVEVQAAHTMQTELADVVKHTTGYSMSNYQKMMSARLNNGLIQEYNLATDRALAEVSNDIAMRGYGDPTTQTIYGFINNPDFNAPTQVASGAGGIAWGQKTAIEIEQDLVRDSILTLTQQIGDPNAMIGMDAAYSATLAIAASLRYTLETRRYVDNQSVSVMDKIKKEYPFLKVLYVSELDGAIGGDNAFYLFLDRHPMKALPTFVNVKPCMLHMHAPTVVDETMKVRKSTSSAGMFLTFPAALVIKYGI